jgi:hypothetical protein
MESSRNGWAVKWSQPNARSLRLAPRPGESLPTTAPASLIRRTYIRLRSVAAPAAVSITVTRPEPRSMTQGTGLASPSSSLTPLTSPVSVSSNAMSAKRPSAGSSGSGAPSRPRQITARWCSRPSASRVW